MARSEDYHPYFAAQMGCDSFLGFTWSHYACEPIPGKRAWKLSAQITEGAIWKRLPSAWVRGQSTLAHA